MLFISNMLNIFKVLYSFLPLIFGGRSGWISPGRRPNLWLVWLSNRDEPLWEAHFILFRSRYWIYRFVNCGELIFELLFV